jgi:hypothetical protein
MKIATPDPRPMVFRLLDSSEPNKKLVETVSFKVDKKRRRDSSNFSAAPLLTAFATLELLLLNYTNCGRLTARTPSICFAKFRKIGIDFGNNGKALSCEPFKKSFLSLRNS